MHLSRNSAGPNPIFPTSGSNFPVERTVHTALFFDSATRNDPNDSYESPEFHKWRFNAEWYIPIGRPMGADKSKQFVLKVAAKYGFMGDIITNIDLFHHLNVSRWVMQVWQMEVTSWDMISLLTVVILFMKVQIQKSIPTNRMLNSSLPCSISIPWNCDFRFQPIRAALFMDAWFEAANGWYDYKAYNPFRLRRSAGVGMRFFLPMFGLLGFDYGVGFDRITTRVKLKGCIPLYLHAWL